MKKIIFIFLAVIFLSACEKSVDTSAKTTSINPVIITPTTTGKIVINPQFDDGNSFSEGLAPIRIGNLVTGKWGYINKEGKMVINPQFNDANSFSEGLARIRFGDYQTGAYGFINKEEKMVINPQFDNAKDFSEGLALVSFGGKDLGKYGYISR